MHASCPRSTFALTPRHDRVRCETGRGPGHTRDVHPAPPLVEGRSLRVGVALALAITSSIVLIGGPGGGLPLVVFVLGLLAPGLLAPLVAWALLTGSVFAFAYVRGTTPGRCAAFLAASIAGYGAAIGAATALIDEAYFVELALMTAMPFALVATVGLGVMAAHVAEAREAATED